MALGTNVRFLVLKVVVLNYEKVVCLGTSPHMVGKEGYAYTFNEGWP